MAFTRIPYCTVDDVKVLLDEATTKYDDLLATLIPQAQDEIDSYLNKSYQTDGSVAAPATRTYDGSGTSQMLIDPLSSLATVTLKTYATGADPATGKLARTLVSTFDITADVQLLPAGVAPARVLARYSGEAFPVGRGNVEVQGVFGYPAAPAWLKRATALLAIHYKKTLDANYEDQVGSTGLGQPVFRKAMPQNVRDVLDRNSRAAFYM